MGAFNQEQALVGAFSVIVQLRRLIANSSNYRVDTFEQLTRGGFLGSSDVEKLRRLYEHCTLLYCTLYTHCTQVRARGRHRPVRGGGHGGAARERARGSSLQVHHRRPVHQTQGGGQVGSSSETTGNKHPLTVIDCPGSGTRMAMTPALG